jgi:hypothetical protein
MATNYIFLRLQAFNTDQHKITQQPLNIIKEDLPCMSTQKNIQTVILGVSVNHKGWTLHITEFDYMYASHVCTDEDF